MASVESVSPIDTAHKIANAVVAESSAVPTARSCLALVPAGFWTPVAAETPPKPAMPPVHVWATPFWLRPNQPVNFITEHLKRGCTVYAKAGLTWCSAATRHIGKLMSAKMTRVGVPHTWHIEEKDGFYTLVFIPEVK